MIRRSMLRKNAVLLLRAVSESLESAYKKLEQADYTHEARTVKAVKDIIDIVIEMIG